MTDNVEIFEFEGTAVIPPATFVIITNPDGSTTSMLKSTWDELEAAKENGTIS